MDRLADLLMKKTDLTLIKLGGSLITYKQDQDRINDYLNQIDLFLAGSGSLDKLQQKVLALTNIEQLNRIFEK